VFFITSLISVVTGSTSLITVPVMIALGIEGRVAVATNMLALIFMSVGGSLPFIAKGVLSRSRLLPSIVFTIIGSGLGALANEMLQSNSRPDIVATVFHSGFEGV